MRVELAEQRISFPPQCTCCGEPANADHSIASAKKGTQNSIAREWHFPMCEQCHIHLGIYQNGSRMAGVSLGLGVLCAFVMISWWAIVGGILLAFAAAYWAQSKAEASQRPTCATTRAPVTFVIWQGTFQLFNIQSDVYATAFLRENASKAVNLSSEAPTASAGTNADLTRQSVH